MSSKPNSDNPNYNTSRHKDKTVEPVKATPKVLSLEETLSATSKVVILIKKTKRGVEPLIKNLKRKTKRLFTSQHPTI